VRNSNLEGNALETRPARLRCAIYTRKSTEEGLDQEFNSLDAQREAAEAFIQSQRREGWIALPQCYDDGGFTGANLDRPAVKRLLHAVEAGELDCVVVYKVDRLSRSLLDFTRMLSIFEKYKVSFVAVTQQFKVLEMPQSRVCWPGIIEPGGRRASDGAKRISTCRSNSRWTLTPVLA
jgi:DNA invertase Pin-like site-specific DNA recombinase